MDKGCLEDPYLFLERRNGEWYACYYRRSDRKNPAYKVEKIDIKTQESDDELPR